MLGITFFTSNTLLIVVSPTEKQLCLLYVVSVKYSTGVEVIRRAYFVSAAVGTCSELDGCVSSVLMEGSSSGQGKRIRKGLSDELLR